jgi:hypothetical protein
MRVYVYKSLVSFRPKGGISDGLKILLTGRDPSLPMGVQDDMDERSCHSNRRERDPFWKFLLGCNIPTQECVGYEYNFPVSFRLKGGISDGLKILLTSRDPSLPMGVQDDMEGELQHQ